MEEESVLTDIEMEGGEELDEASADVSGGKGEEISADSSSTGKDAFRDRKRQYTLEERKSLGELCHKFKADFDREYAAGKLMYDKKKKKYVQPLPKEGFISRAVHEKFPSLKKTPSSDPRFRAACQVACRTY